jgi:hypothetical protein
MSAVFLFYNFISIVTISVLPAMALKIDPKMMHHDVCLSYVCVLSFVCVKPRVYIAPGMRYTVLSTGNHNGGTDHLLYRVVHTNVAGCDMCPVHEGLLWKDTMGWRCILTPIWNRSVNNTNQTLPSILGYGNVTFSMQLVISVTSFHD